jgi:head-tail adaptor
MIPVFKLPYAVLVKAKTVSYSDIGLPTESWGTGSSIQADIQPIGGEIAERQYGIIETGITARMFCNPSDDVQAGSRVEHGSDIYEIRHVARYRGHIEALLRGVI